MSSKPLFQQNIIAVIWDFDKTLSPHYMQRPLFARFGIDEAVFWREVNALPEYYARAGITVSRDTAYLGHLLAYVQHGRMPGLGNALLRELGAKITFYPGVPEIFDRLTKIAADREFEAGDTRVQLEHYVVSTGLKEMVRGSAINDKLAGIWASEFIETPAPPGGALDADPPAGTITQIAAFLDNTTKTRAIFEINKGVNKQPDISVNDMIPEDARRVPIRNMIYVADGPSDIPSFSVIRKHNGRAFAVYTPGSREDSAQAERLLSAGRVDAHGPADYREGGHTALWLENQVREIAARIRDERRARRRPEAEAPRHRG